jgi:hypothetical protein
MALDNRDNGTAIGTAPFELLDVRGIDNSTSMCVRDLFNGNQYRLGYKRTVHTHTHTHSFVRR